MVALAALGGAFLRSLDQSANTVRLSARALPSHFGNGATATTLAPPPDTSNGTGGDTATVPAPTTTVAAPPTGCGNANSVDGPVIDTRWGPVQVRAKIGDGNRVCSADAIQTPNDHDRSVFINQQAVPWIDDEVKTQGVNFDSIGGDTITSDAYRESVQAILDGRAK